MKEEIRLLLFRRDKKNRFLFKTGGLKCVSPVRIIRNIPGLLIQGVDMSDIHPDSEINDEEKDLLKQYGVIFDGSKKSSKTDIVILEQSFRDSNINNKR